MKPLPCRYKPTILLPLPRCGQADVSMTPNENRETPADPNRGTPNSDHQRGGAGQAHQPDQAGLAGLADAEPRKAPESPSQDHSWAGDDAGRPAALRMAGLGLELAGSTLAMAGLGYVIDTARGHQTPYATIAAALVGFSLGMYRLISIAIKSLDDSDG